MVNVVLLYIAIYLVLFYRWARNVMYNLYYPGYQCWQDAGNELHKGADAVNCTM